MIKSVLADCLIGIFLFIMVATLTNAFTCYMKEGGWFTRQGRPFENAVQAGLCFILEVYILLIFILWSLIASAWVLGLIGRRFASIYNKRIKVD